MSQSPGTPETDPVITASHEATVGALTVRRALPRRGRRSIGAWCFADHFGPADVDETHGLDVGPHPHTGLHTVTWLVEGQALHRDSLGSEQVIAPGQLNLMTAGHGITHAEEATGRYHGSLQGIQLWIAQPDATRHGPAAFEHHGALPQLELTNGQATVLIGNLHDVASPARRDSELVGVELRLRGATTLALRREFEYGLIVVTGQLSVEGRPLTPGHLAYLRPGRDSLGLDATSDVVAMLLGGVALDELVAMWWNFVARSRDELDEARQSWQRSDDRFGKVTSSLARIEAPAPYWPTPGSSQPR